MSPPPIEPHARGHLDIGDDNRLHWESSGNPHGKPALWLHGGPGAGGGRGSRRPFAATWPAAELVVIDDSGHTGSPAMSEALHAATARFAPAAPGGAHGSGNLGPCRD